MKKNFFTIRRTGSSNGIGDLWQKKKVIIQISLNKSCNKN
jgi:hypothetical protein